MGGLSGKGRLAGRAAWRPAPGASWAPDTHVERAHGRARERARCCTPLALWAHADVRTDSRALRPVTVPLLDENAEARPRVVRQELGAQPGRGLSRTRAAAGRRPPVRSGCRSGSVGRSSLTRQSQSPARARAARSRPCPSGAARWPARGVGLSCCLGLSAARRLRGWPMEGGRRDSLAWSLSAAGKVSPCRAGSTGSSGRSERCGRWSAGICYCA